MFPEPRPPNMRVNLTVALVAPLARGVESEVEASGSPSHRFAVDAPAGYPRRSTDAWPMSVVD